MTLLERPYPNWPLSRLSDTLYGFAWCTEALQEIAMLSPLSESWRSLAKQRLKTCLVEDWHKRLGEP